MIMLIESIPLDLPSPAAAFGVCHGMSGRGWGPASSPHGRAGRAVSLTSPCQVLQGGSENVADSLLAFLLTLQDLTRLGISVWILHHPRKGEIRSGQAARGSGVLGGVDILLEMGWYGQTTEPDRRRVIAC